MDRLFDLYKSTWPREKHLRLVGWSEDFVSRTLFMRMSDLGSSLPSTSRQAAKSAEFGRRLAPWLIGLALVLAPAAANAEAPIRLPFEHAAIPGTDLRLEIDGGLDGGLSVRRGKVRARVPVDLPYPELLIGVSATATPTTVTVKAEANCEGPQTFTLSRARLEALLENAAARSLTRAKQWDGAAAGFSRALAADPTLSEAATNLAVAQVHAQRPTDAVATLAHAAAHDPIWVAWRLAADPDLVPPRRRAAAGQALRRPGAPSVAPSARRQARGVLPQPRPLRLEPVARKLDE